MTEETQTKTQAETALQVIYAKNDAYDDVDPPDMISKNDEDPDGLKGSYIYQFADHSILFWSTVDGWETFDGADDFFAVTEEDRDEFQQLL